MNDCINNKDRNTAGRYIKQLKNGVKRLVLMLPFVMSIDQKKMEMNLISIKLIQWKASFLPKLSNTCICSSVHQSSCRWISLSLIRKPILSFANNGIGTVFLKRKSNGFISYVLFVFHNCL